MLHIPTDNIKMQYTFDTSVKFKFYWHWHFSRQFFFISQQNCAGIRDIK